MNKSKISMYLLIAGLVALLLSYYLKPSEIDDIEDSDIDTEPEPEPKAKRKPKKEEPDLSNIPDADIVTDEVKTDG